MMIASRKRGTVMPRNEMNESAVSTQLYCRVAAMMPRLMPNSVARMWQVSARTRVRRQALGDDVAHRPVVVEAVAEIALA